MALLSDTEDIILLSETPKSSIEGSNRPDQEKDGSLDMLDNDRPSVTRALKGKLHYLDVMKEIATYSRDHEFLNYLQRFQGYLHQIHSAQATSACKTW